MRLPRNPFRSNKVESLESHDLFLKLFQPIALGALDDDPWSSVQIIRSAQGGGKTSLLRALTPECLLRVAEGTSPYLSDIAEQMRRIGAISESSPTTLGVYIPLGSTPYAAVARTSLGDQNPLHLFYTLLDARVILSTLRGVEALCGLSLDEEPSRISFSWPNDNANPIYEHASVTDLMQWARTAEKNIWRAIDRGNASSVADLGHARPYSLEALSHTSILVDCQPICERVLVMVDDAHKLVSEQRKALLDHVITSRLKVSFWASERMYAMEPYELLALDTSSTNRECRPVVLSMWWQKATDGSMGKFYNELATKRLQESDVETPFDQLLKSVVDESGDHERVVGAIASLTSKLEAVKGSDARFSEIDLSTKHNQKPLESLIDLKSLELFVSGVKSKSQATFDFEAIIPNPTSTELSGLRATAEYQACWEYSLPLYYGAQSLYKIASWNVDQFLALASNLFDQYEAQRIRSKGPKIAARTQERLIQEVAKAYYSGLPKRMPNGDRMQRFLQAFSRYALTESLADTAKYPPGVTGFGFTSKDHDRLRNCSAAVDSHLVELASLLSSAVAHNVVFMRPDSKQGKAGETVTVFYLNRLLCVYFGLPIGLGGWWKRKVDHFATLLKEDKLPLEELTNRSLFSTGAGEFE